jgi:hypothetical protein
LGMMDGGWINDTNGTAGAFDVTTKGNLHSLCIHNNFFYSQQLLLC